VCVCVCGSWAAPPRLRPYWIKKSLQGARDRARDLFPAPAGLSSERYE
jgi:hypothetical protein